MNKWQTIPWWWEGTSFHGACFHTGRGSAQCRALLTPCSAALPPALPLDCRTVSERQKEREWERRKMQKRESVCVRKRERVREKGYGGRMGKRKTKNHTKTFGFHFFFSGDKLLRAFVIKKRSCKSSCPHVLPKFFPHYFYPFKLVWQRRPLRPCLVLSWLMLPSLCLCKSPHITFRK